MDEGRTGTALEDDPDGRRWESDPFSGQTGQEIHLSDAEWELNPHDAGAANVDGLPDGWPICGYCNEPILEYSGSGRRPKWHPEHRPSVLKSGGGTPRTRTSGGVTARGNDKALNGKLKGIADGLADNVRLMGAIAIPQLPVTGHIIMRDADGVSVATVKLARNNPKILAALEKAAEISAGVTVGRFFANVVTGIAVDTERIPPNAPIAMALGVTAMWHEVQKKVEDNAAAYVAPPPSASFL